MTARDRKLKGSLDRYKGVDYKLQKQKKMQKEAAKRKRKQQESRNVPEEDYMMRGALTPLEEKEDAIAKNANGELSKEKDAAEEEEEKESVWDTEEDDEEGGGEAEIDISKLHDRSDSDSDSDGDEEQEVVEDDQRQNGGSETSDVDDEDDEDIPLSDIASVASDEKGDIIPHQRLTINNHTALLAAHKRIALPLPKLPFSAHQSVTSSEAISIPDINDDLNRELAIYKQALTAVQSARDLLKKEGVPFSRPADYFAEMVKSDEHMGRVKQKLVDAAASKKAAQDARRQRELKKFGKQVQVEKRQEREREKREMLERVQRLKRKRANAPLTNENEPDLFDVELKDEDESKQSKRRRSDGPPADGKRALNAKRQAKDKKYGFGGKRRFSKSGDAMSSSDMRGFSVARMKGKTGGKGGKMRPGKSRRAKGRP